MRFSKALLLFPLCLFVLTLSAPAWAAADTADEIRRLVNEAPPLASFPDAKGMIWKSQLEYRLLADGSMEKVTSWFILSGGDLPEAWRTWSPAVGPGGSIEVLESGIFDPVTGRIVTPLIPQKTEGQGFMAVEVRSPELEEERVLCVSFREIIPNRYNVDDFLWAAYDLPFWEQTVIVEVPSESDFHWEGRGVPRPSMEEGKGVRRYTWTAVNREADGQATVALSRRPYLSFSLRKGIRPALDDLGGITRGVAGQVPGSLGRVLRSGPTKKHVRRFLGALDAPSHRMEELPGRFVRPSSGLAGAKSWTDWERTILAGAWLRNAGAEVNLFWLPKAAQGKDTPASPMAWARPVLEIKPKGGEVFFWSAGQKDPVGSAYSLSGKTLYRVQNGGFQSLKVPSGEVEDHRLILAWDLNLSETGAVEGTLKVDVRGGWLDLLGDASLGVKALDPVVRMPGLPQFVMGSPVIRQGGESVRIEFPVSFNAGIPSGAGALLVRFPSAGFPALDVKGSSSGDGLSLRYPFVIDQRYNIHLPQDYHVVALPSLAGSESGPVRFSEELRERTKKGRLEGAFRMVVTKSDLDAPQAGAFAGISRRVAQWGSLTIPLKK